MNYFLSTHIITIDNTQSIDLALEVSEYFGIELKQAKEIVKAMKKEVAAWQRVAKSYGLNMGEIAAMESAFDVD